MAAGCAKPRLLVTHGPPFSFYAEPQVSVVFEIPAQHGPSYLTGLADRMFPVAETSDCSFISSLLFRGERSFSWVQRTTCFCFPCSYMCPVTRSWPVR